MIIEEWLARVGKGAQRLRAGPSFDPNAIIEFPDEARDLIEASVDLYGRIYRLDQGEEIPQPMENPVRGLLRRLERSI
jgi:regulator of CtrA degradation